MSARVSFLKFCSAAAPVEKAVTTMKYLLVLVVVAVLVWMLMARQRSRSKDTRQDGAGRNSKPPTAMLACAHCGLLLPPDEATHDAAGRPFCSQAHSLAGPR
jgi:uncharacterized protein